jgi:outer membrane immunogenic protein
MKHRIAGLATAIALSLSGAATAADLAPARSVAPAPDRTFSGLYVAALAGLAAGQLRDEDGFKIPREGYTAGIALGLQRQSHGLLVGAEADLALTDISGETNAMGFTVKGSSKALGSLRMRLGAVHGPALYYLTAGAALTNAKLAVDGLGDDTRNTKGFVVGAGLETRIIGNMGLRLELLRYQWGDRGFVLTGAATPELKSHDTHVRGGLVFKLN